MKKIVHDFWLSRGTMIAVACFFLALIMIFSAMLSLQRRDYRRTSDASLARAIEEIRSEVRSLRAADEKSVVERRRIKEEVRAVKEAVER